MRELEELGARRIRSAAPHAGENAAIRSECLSNKAVDADEATIVIVERSMEMKMEL